jgi:hypothetical protein
MTVPQKLSKAAMAAIVSAAIAAGNNGGNSGGGGSSGGGGGCDDEDIGGYSDGGAHRQQSTKSNRERNGEDNTMSEDGNVRIPPPHCYPHLRHLTASGRISRRLVHSCDCLTDLNFAKKVKEGFMGGSFNFVSSGEL